MKKAFKKILCSLLVVVMCLTSAPLQGLGLSEYEGSVVKSTAISVPDTLNLDVGGTAVVSPSFTPANTSNKEFTITAQDHTYSYMSGIWPFQSTKTETLKASDYISIGTNGVLIGLKETVEPNTKSTFAFVLTVRAKDSGKTDQMRVYVTKKMMTLTYMGDDSPWYYGNSVQLSAALDSSISSKYPLSSLKWTSSDTSVATVSAEGLVTCKGTGPVTITASTLDGKYSASFQIYCRSVINIEKDYFENCQVGIPYQIKATLQPGRDGEKIIFTSTDASVAEVDQSGKVILLKPGSAKIIVMTSFDSVNYKEVWLTSGSFTSPSGTKMELFSILKDNADSVKNSANLPGFYRNDSSVFSDFTLTGKGTFGNALSKDDIYSMFRDFVTPRSIYQESIDSTSNAQLEKYVANVPVGGQYMTIVDGLESGDIKSVLVIDRGSYTYDLKLTLEEERFTYLPPSGINTRHGKVFDILTDSIISGAFSAINNSGEELRIEYGSFAQRYHDSSLTVSVNKVTGEIENMKYDMNIDITVTDLKLSFSGVTYTADISFDCNNIVDFEFVGCCDHDPCEFGHIFDNYISDGNANCIIDGLKIAKCKYCDATDSVPEKGEHTYSEKWSFYIEPTCTEDGQAKRTCLVCADTETVVLPKLDHTLVDIAEKPATCTVSGNTAGVVCSACDEVIRGYEVIPAKGHDYKDVPAKAPTCTAKGNTAGKICKVEGCGATSGGYAVIPETGHDFLEIETVKPSCELETNGKKVKICKVCAYKEDAVDVPWAHTFGSWSIVKEATCTEDGQAKRTCLVCADTETVVLPKLDHTLVDIAEKPATCTEAGNSAGKKCLVCTYREGGTAVPAKGHNYQTEWQTIVAPTCTEAGVAIKICKNCFEIQTNTLPVVEHIDSNADYKCDICTFGMTPPQPEQPQDPTENCDCGCHKSGIANFFFRLGLFFQKLFKKNQICEGCGAYHY